MHTSTSHAALNQMFKRWLKFKSTSTKMFLVDQSKWTINDFFELHSFHLSWLSTFNLWIKPRRRNMRPIQIIQINKMDRAIAVKTKNNVVRMDWPYHLCLLYYIHPAMYSMNQHHGCYFLSTHALQTIMAIK